MDSGPVPRLVLLVGFLTALPGPTPVEAQAVTTAPAHVAHVEGPVTLERAGAAEPLERGMPLAAGDTIRTADGRAELLLSDGSLVWVDEGSALAWLSPAHVRLEEGTIAVDRLAAAGADTPGYDVTTRAGSMRLDSPGAYRIRASDTRPGTLDAGRFAAWIGTRRAAREGAGLSRARLPHELQVYAATFDASGRWATDATYGAVWYPAVAPGWRPYYNGHWRWIPRFGWTWIADGTWGWPTHHYGRWGLGEEGRWYWIPGRQWAPAWVSWAVGPAFVSWTATGGDDRPVVRFPSHDRYVNERVFERDFAVNRRVFDPDFAWTTIPTHALGTPARVADVAVAGRQLVERDGVPFIQQRRAPRGPDARPAQPAAWLSAPARRWVGRRAAAASPRGSARDAGRRPRGNADVRPAPPPAAAAPPAGIWWGGRAPGRPRAPAGRAPVTARSSRPARSGSSGRSPGGGPPEGASAPAAGSGSPRPAGAPRGRSGNPGPGGGWRIPGASAARPPSWGRLAGGKR